MAAQGMIVCSAQEQHLLIKASSEHERLPNSEQNYLIDESSEHECLFNSEQNLLISSTSIYRIQGKKIFTDFSSELSIF